MSEYRDAEELQLQNERQQTKINCLNAELR